VQQEIKPRVIDTDGFGTWAILTQNDTHSFIHTHAGMCAADHEKMCGKKSSHV